MSMQQILIPYGIFNINKSARGNGIHICDKVILCSFGNFINVYDLSLKRSVLIKRMEGDNLNINIMEISADRKLLAVSQEGIQASLTVLALKISGKSIKLKKVFVMPKHGGVSKKYICLKFSADSVYLGVILGAPDWLLMVYDMRTGHIVFNMSFKLNDGARNLTDLAFSPDEHDCLVVVGSGIIKIFRFSSIKKNWKLLGNTSVGNISLVTVCWLSGDLIFSGSTDGRIICVGNGVIRGLINCLADEFVLSINQENFLYGSVSRHDFNIDLDVSSLAIILIVPLRNGFLFCCQCGRVIVFEETREGWYNRTIDQHLRILSLDNCEVTSVNTVSYSHSNSYICINLYEGVIILLRMKEADITEKHYLVFSLHHDSLSSLSTCILKPLILSTGKFDNRVVLWDYKLSLPLKYWLFESSVLHAALHPSGIFCLLIFPDKFAFSYIDLYDFCLEILEFYYESVNVGAFAESGGLFAVGNSSSVGVYSSLNLEKKFTIKTNIDSTLTSLYFCDNDLCLWSCSLKGRIWKWRVCTGKIVWAGMDSFTDDNCTMAVKKNEIIYVLGTNGKVMEIGNGGVKKMVDSDIGCMDSISVSTNTMVLGGRNGTLVFPCQSLNNSGFEHTAYVNNKSIDRVLAATDNNIFAASVDGGIYMYFYFMGCATPYNKRYKSSYISYLLSLVNVGSTLPRNVMLLKDFQKQLSRCTEEHIRELYIKQNNSSVLELIVSINSVLINLFVMKTLSYYYRKKVASFNLYANRYKEISKSSEMEISDFYTSEELRIFLAAKGKYCLKKLIRPSQSLMQFVNDKFFVLYKLTKQVIKKAIPKSLRLTMKKINQVMRKISHITYYLNKYLFLLNNPLNQIRFLVCGLFHKSFVRPKLLKHKELIKQVTWEVELIILRECEEKLLIKLLTEYKRNTALYLTHIRKGPHELELNVNLAQQKRHIQLVEFYNNLKNVLLTSKYIHSLQEHY